MSCSAFASASAIRIRTQRTMRCCRLILLIRQFSRCAFSFRLCFSLFPLFLFYFLLFYDKSSSLIVFSQQIARLALFPGECTKSFVLQGIFCRLAGCFDCKLLRGCTVRNIYKKNTLFLELNELNKWQRKHWKHITAERPKRWSRISFQRGRKNIAIIKFVQCTKGKLYLYLLSTLCSYWMLF